MKDEKVSRTQLVLDVAGVLVTNFSPTFWGEISTIANVPPRTLKELFKQEVREPLWTGVMSEQRLWDWLSGRFPSKELPYERSRIEAHLQPLPALALLEAWSQLADIHLLSNHRHEWLERLLDPVKPYIKSATISSQVGLCKPNPAIYKLVQSQAQGSPIIYVDDQEKNLIPARELGWTSVLADHEGSWIEEVTSMLRIYSSTVEA